MYKTKKILSVLIVIVLVISALVISPPVQKAIAYDNNVVPIDWSIFAGNPNDTASLKLRDVLLRADKFLLNTWWNAPRTPYSSYASQTGTYLNFPQDPNGIGEWRYPKYYDAIYAAMSLAITLKTGIYDQAITGVTFNDAKTRTVKLIKSLAYHHFSQCSDPNLYWNGDSEDHMFIAMLGLAGWLMWDDLEAGDKTRIRDVVIYGKGETWPAAIYQRNKSGTIVWDPVNNPVDYDMMNYGEAAIYTCMMPNTSDRNSWLNYMYDNMISDNSRPQDVNAPDLYNGKTISEWLDGLPPPEPNYYSGGSVLDSDGTSTHHGLTPSMDYTMVCFDSLVYGAATFTLAGWATPESVFFNMDNIYYKFAEYDWWPSDPNKGAFYVPGSGELSWPPSGSDWTDLDQPGCTMLDAGATFFGYDSLCDPNANGNYWLLKHAQKCYDLQERYINDANAGPGRTYKPDGSEFYGGYDPESAEAATSYYYAWAYLVRWTGYQWQQNPSRFYKYTESVPDKFIDFEAYTTDGAVISGVYGGIDWGTGTPAWKSYGADAGCGMTSRNAYVDSPSTSAVSKTIVLPLGKKLKSIKIGTYINNTGTVQFSNPGNTTVTYTLVGGTANVFTTGWTSTTNPNVTITITNSEGAGNVCFDDLIYSGGDTTLDFEAYTSNGAVISGIYPTPDGIDWGTTTPAWTSWQSDAGAGMTSRNAYVNSPSTAAVSKTIVLPSGKKLKSIKIGTYTNNTGTVQFSNTGNTTVTYTLVGGTANVFTTGWTSATNQNVIITITNSGGAGNVLFDNLVYGP